MALRTILFALNYERIHLKKKHKIKQTVLTHFTMVHKSILDCSTKNINLTVQLVSQNSRNSSIKPVALWRLYLYNTHVKNILIWIYYIPFTQQNFIYSERQEFLILLFISYNLKIETLNDMLLSVMFYTVFYLLKKDLPSVITDVSSKRRNKLYLQKLIFSLPNKCMETFSVIDIFSLSRMVLLSIILIAW